MTEGKEGRQGPPQSPEERDLEEEEYYGRTRQEEHARGTATLETLKSAPSPDLVLSAVTEILQDFEDLDKAEAYDRYSLKPFYQAASERARALGKTVEELEERKIIERVEDKEGNHETYEDGTPKYITNVSGYSLENRRVQTTKTREQVVEEFTIDEKGEEKGIDRKVRRTTERSTEDVPYYGTNEERERLAEAYRAAEKTLIVREKLHNLYAFAYLPHTANLSGLVENFFIKFPQFSNEQISNLFNLPDFRGFRKDPENPEKLVDPENNDLGQRIDLAMRLFYVVSRSEKKSKMQELMATPGFQDILLPSVAGESEAEQNAWKSEWIGDVDAWTDDDKRTKKTYKKNEREQRGLLAKWGNLFAHGDVNQELVVGLIGEAVGDQVAAELAFRFFKISGLASEEGCERYGEGPVDPELAKKAAEGEISEDEIESLEGRLELAGDPDTDDLTKLMHFRGYREKELVRTDGGRVAGPETSLDSIDKLTLSLFRVAATKTEYGTRSLMEQWWGYPEKGSFPKEEAHRLGELNWNVNWGEELKELAERDPDLKKYSREGVWGGYSLFLFLAGRGESKPLKGIYNFMYAEDFDPNDFVKRDFWRHKNKFISIVVNNKLLASRGNYRKLYEKFGPNQDEKVKDELEIRASRAATSLKKGFWRGVQSLPQWKALWESMRLRQKRGVQSYLTAEAERVAKKYGYQD